MHKYWISYIRTNKRGGLYMDNNNCCIEKIIKIICKLQSKAEKFDDIPNSCDRPFLWCNTSACLYTTRPVTFYNRNNELITLNYTLNDETGTSSVFRVEKTDGCCCTCRVLAPNPDATAALDNPYVATNSFYTLNCNCICVLQCLPDTFVDCIWKGEI